MIILGRFLFHYLVTLPTSSKKRVLSACVGGGRSLSEREGERERERKRLREREGEREK